MISLNGEPELAGKLAERIQSGCAGIIYMDAVDYAGIERLKGRLFSKRFNLVVEAMLEELKQEWASMLAALRAGADWVLFIGFAEADPDAVWFRLKELARRLKGIVEERLRDVFGREEFIVVYTGCAVLQPSSEKSLEQLVYSAVKRSILSIHGPSIMEENALKRTEFHSIIGSRNITSVYQPIVSLQNAAVFGFEALTRGPRDSAFHSPLALFEYAEKHGELYVLDRLAREKAIEGCGGLHRNQRVFINIPAQVIHDPQFAPGVTMKALEEHGIDPHNVVFEITERSSIEDFATAKQILKHYRTQGYQIAIDDAGAGYSSLQAIAELKPDFIKVDRSLIQDIHMDKMKESILETFVSFARKMGIRIIAEGIESWEELKKLAQMGVHYGQGYLLGRPAPSLTPVGDDIASHIGEMNAIRQMDGILQIGSLASSIQCFDQDSSVSQVAEYFNRCEDAAGTVIISGGSPVGLVMREKLFQQLAGQYGVSLYWNRSIAQLMDQNPLIVDESTPIEKVSQMAMSREKNRLYDLIVITTGGKMKGAASIQTMLEEVMNLRMETARVANPLTGLPGNTRINQEMIKRIADEMPFSVIYADLDYFKWFNDRFGFQKGDQLIQYTADVLQQSVAACGHPHDFVGHIGGDDFIVMTATPHADQLCEDMIRRFRQDVGFFYKGENWSGVLDRKGDRIESDGMHISLSLVICTGTRELTLESISRTSAVLKKQAKSQTGSVYVTAYLDEASPAYVSNSDKSSSIL